MVFRFVTQPARDSFRRITGVPLPSLGDGCDVITGELPDDGGALDNEMVESLGEEKSRIASNKLDMFSRSLSDNSKSSSAEVFASTGRFLPSSMMDGTAAPMAFADVSSDAVVMAEEEGSPSSSKTAESGASSALFPSNESMTIGIDVGQSGSVEKLGGNSSSRSPYADLSTQTRPFSRLGCSNRPHAATNTSKRKQTHPDGKAAVVSAVAGSGAIASADPGPK